MRPGRLLPLAAADQGAHDKAMLAASGLVLLAGLAIERVFGLRPYCLITITP